MAGVGKLVSLLLVLASVDPIIGQNKTEERYLYHLPWACSVLYKDESLIGACAIFELRRVLVSVDNFYEAVPGSYPPKRFFEVIDERMVYVHAGSNFMNPQLLERKLPFAQSQRATSIVVAFKRPEVNNGKWDARFDIKDLSQKDGSEQDAYGFAFNVGILNILVPFQASPYVRPIPINVEDVERETNAFERLHAYIPQHRAHTCVTYSWNQKQNRIRYHEVTFQPHDACIEAFCGWNLLHCGTFPTKDYLKCFKSVKYADVCPNARGAALYCPSFKNSVFAILTTALSCGTRHLPGVYTTLPKIIDFFKDRFDLEHRIKYDPFFLKQQNSDYPGVL